MNSVHCSECNTKINGCAVCEKGSISCSKCKVGLFLYDSNSDSKYDSCVDCKLKVKNDGSRICDTFYNL